MCCTCQQRFTLPGSCQRHERDAHGVFHTPRSVSTRGSGNSSDSSVPVSPQSHSSPSSDTGTDNSLASITPPSTPALSPVPSPLPSPPLTTGAPSGTPPSLPLSSPSSGQTSPQQPTYRRTGNGFQCKSCLFVFSTLARYNNHGVCRFRCDQAQIGQDQMPVTILNKPKNMEATLTILKMLPDVEQVKLAIAQSWWIPRLYPFIFPGQVRSGNQGLPPVLKDCTANDESKRLLNLLIRVEGRRVEIPRNIIIVHENGDQSLIPESMLTPTSHFSTQVLQTTLSVSTGNVNPQSDQSTASDQSDSDSDIVTNVPVDGDGDTNQNDEGQDDTVVVESPQRTSSQLRYILDLRNDPRFEPGQDGFGALHKDQRTVSPFRYPWIMTSAEFEVYCRMTKDQFLDFESSSRVTTASWKKSGLNSYAQCLLFQMKVCHDLTFPLLGSLFNVDVVTAINVFLRILFHQFLHNNNIPNILDINGQLVPSERDKLLTTAYNNTPTYFKEMVKDFKDPDGRGRTPVILNTDATYSDTTSSQDIGKY